MNFFYLCFGTNALYFQEKWEGLDGLRGPILSGTGFYMKRDALYGTQELRKQSNLIFPSSQLTSPLDHNLFAYIIIRIILEIYFARACRC